MKCATDLKMRLFAGSVCLFTAFQTKTGWQCAPTSRDFRTTFWKGGASYPQRSIAHAPSAAISFTELTTEARSEACWTSPAEHASTAVLTSAGRSALEYRSIELR